MSSARCSHSMTSILASCLRRRCRFTFFRRQRRTSSMLPAPLPAVEDFVLPVPVFIPIPAWCNPPDYVVPPPNNVIFTNIHNTIIVNRETNFVTVRNGHAESVASEQRGFEQQNFERRASEGAPLARCRRAAARRPCARRLAAPVAGAEAGPCAPAGIDGGVPARATREQAAIGSAPARHARAAAPAAVWPLRHPVSVGGCATLGCAGFSCSPYGTGTCHAEHASKQIEHRNARPAFAGNARAAVATGA